LCVHTPQTVFEYLFLFCFEVNLCARWNSSQYHFRACHDIFQHPVYTLFTAAVLFYLDIPHKNSIELGSAGCSLAAFEDEMFAGVFSGRRPVRPTEAASGLQTH